MSKTADNTIIKKKQWFKK